ncbi:MAG TPA: HDOD domain-containing protein [Steroidobacteraceae bacterium]|nr:HDOD domain-containing protein [Steroidobacteraceae bacterium]
MSGATVVQLRVRTRPESLTPEAPRVVAAFSNALLRSPPKPPGLAACVGYLQEEATQLQSRQMGMRALETLRSSLFMAPGREAEMALLWREALATACFARVIAVQTRFDAPLLTGAGLLHRAGEITALRALAQAEREAGQRLVGPVMDEILSARDDELVSRVTRCWSLPGELRLLILRWREEQNQIQRPESVDLLTMAQAFATELVHAATCTPGLVEVARDALKLPMMLVEQARAATQGIESLLARLAPLPAATA